MFMAKVLVLYYSASGNTRRMAEAVADGVRAAGVDVDLEYHVDAEDLANYDAIVVGAPTYNHNMPLEISGIFKEAAAKNVNLRNKIGGAFGSYGWSGEAPNLVLEVMEKRFEMRVIRPPILARYAPGRAELEKCRELGREIAEKILGK